MLECSLHTFAALSTGAQASGQMVDVTQSSHLQRGSEQANDQAQPSKARAQEGRDPPERFPALQGEQLCAAVGSLQQQGQGSVERAITHLAALLDTQCRDGKPALLPGAPLARGTSSAAAPGWHG